MTHYHVSFFNGRMEELCRFVFSDMADAISTFLDFCLEIRQDVSGDDRTYYTFKIFEILSDDVPGVVALESEKLTIAIVKCEKDPCVNPLNS